MRGRKNGLGCLGFLARTLTKVDSKPKPRPLVPPKPIHLDDEDDEFEEEAPPPEPIVMRECSDPRLRAEVDQLLGTRMRADHQTYARVLRECGKQQAFLEGKQVHSHICIGGYEPDEYLCNRLISMYGACGCIPEAKHVFDRMATRSVYTLTIMITAFAQNGHMQDASELFENMKYPNVVTWNAMVSAYAQNGYLPEAREIFERMPERDAVSWNAIVAAYAHAGHFVEALVFFRKMDLEGTRPDRITFLHALNACSRIDDGVMVHMSIVESEIEINLPVATGLVMMYGKCGFPDAALQVFRSMQRFDLILWTAIIVAQAQNRQMTNASLVFEKMPQSNVVTWTAMLAGYAENGQGNLAWNLFRLMDLEGIVPNKITLISILDACANSSEVKRGRDIHSCIIQAGLGQEVSICNALINMYGKCKDLESAQLVFSRMRWRNVVSWSALLASYAQNGYGRTAIEIFHTMQMEGVKPNEVTLLSVLSACSHAGLFAEGLEYFVTVPHDYHGINLAADHFAAVADLLSRYKRQTIPGNKMQ